MKFQELATGQRFTMNGAEYEKVEPGNRTNAHRVDNGKSAFFPPMIPVRIMAPDQPQDTAMDFDKGFGIGGLGRHAEPLPVKQVGGQRCRKCHQSEAAGAMFTTNAVPGLCDDCGAY